MELSEKVRKFLGWCPQSCMQMRQLPVPQDEVADGVPAAGGSFRGSAVHWLGSFRNQMMLLTIGTFCAGFYLFAGLGGVSHPDLFLIGILAGLPFSVIAGFLYWRKFNEVVCDGPVVLLGAFDKASGTFAVATTVVIVYGQIYFLLGPDPIIDTTLTNAFFGGFIAVLFWGLLISIGKWESDTSRRLYYDGMILGLEKGDTHGTR
ncbi:MAG: DUF1673 domain-containing protein [Methanoregulaceae archaeon]|nr:DUF1673 domain-containing protein [Methanoregulaceae archaeon]